MTGHLVRLIRIVVPHVQHNTARTYICYAKYPELIFFFCFDEAVSMKFKGNFYLSNIRHHFCDISAELTFYDGSKYYSGYIVKSNKHRLNNLFIIHQTSKLLI